MTILDPKKEKLVIAVEEGARVRIKGNRPDAPNLGILPGHQARRRVFPRKKGKGSFNVYDFTWEKQGAVYVSRDVVAPIEHVENAAAYLNAVLTDHPRNQWTAKYKKLAGELAGTFRISIGLNGHDPAPLDDSNADWTETGLKIKETVTSLLFLNRIEAPTHTYYEDGVIGTPLFPAWQIDNSGGSTHLTAVADINAAAVDLLLKPNRPTNLFVNPAIMRMTGADAGVAIPDTHTSGAYVNLPYPAYRWLFPIDGSCSTAPVFPPGPGNGQMARYNTVTNTGGTDTAVFRGRFRAWDRDKIIANPLATADFNALGVKAIEVMVAMGETKELEQFRSFESGYSFSHQDGGGNFGEFLCGDLSGFVGVSNNTTGYIPSGHGNAYTFMGGSQANLIPGTLAAVINQDDKWFYFWFVGP